MNNDPTKEIRKKYAPVFRPLAKKTPMRAGIVLLAYLLLVIGSIVAGTISIHASTPLAHITVAALSVFIATRLRGINNIVHECSHASFTHSKKWNAIYGCLASAILMKSFRTYRLEHRTHHAYLGHYEQDLDFRNIEEYRLEEPVTAKTLIRHAITPLLGLHLRRYLQFDLSLNDGFRYAAMKAVILYAVAFYAFDSFAAALAFVIIPFAWIHPALNYWTDCIDHGGLLTNKGEIWRSRNMKVPLLPKLVFFPRNDSYHLVHHLFPGVPVEHFHRCHDRLMEDSNYRANHLRTRTPFSEAEAPDDRDFDQSPT